MKGQSRLQLFHIGQKKFFCLDPLLAPQGVIGFAKPFDQPAVIGVKHLSGGGDGGFFYRINPALGIQVKGADGVDLVSPKFQTVGSRCMGRIKIQNTAPLGELADAVHLIPPLIAGVQKLGAQPLDGVAFAGPKVEGVFPQRFGRKGILQKRFDAANRHGNAPLSQTVQHLQAGKFIFAASALHIPEDEFPGRIQKGSLRTGKGVDILAQAGSGSFIRRDHQKRPGFGQGCGYRRLMDMAQPSHLGGPAPFGHSRQKHSVLGCGRNHLQQHFFLSFHFTKIRADFTDRSEDLPANTLLFSIIYVHGFIHSAGKDEAGHIRRVIQNAVQRF